MSGLLGRLPGQTPLSVRAIAEIIFCATWPSAALRYTTDKASADSSVNKNDDRTSQGTTLTLVSRIDELHLDG